MKSPLSFFTGFDDQDYNLRGMWQNYETGIFRWPEEVMFACWTPAFQGTPILESVTLTRIDIRRNRRVMQTFTMSLGLFQLETLTGGYKRWKANTATSLGLFNTGTYDFTIKDSYGNEFVSNPFYICNPYAGYISVVDFDTNSPGDFLPGCCDIYTEDTVTGIGTSEDPIKLVNDVDAPGATKYYGTDNVGAKGYHELPDPTVNTDKSVTGDGSVVTPVELVGDEETPSENKYYGTDGAGARGFHGLPDIVINTEKSVTGDGSALTPVALVGDEEAVGGSKYYGTDTAGTKGFHELNTRFPKDIQRYGFLNQTDTAISFDPVTQIFTLTDMGGGWGYYRDGDLALITGNRTVDVKDAEEGLPLVDGEVYYIYIDDQSGTLIADKAHWTLLDTKVPVSYLVYDNALTPKSWVAEERHACLIDRREHYREHLTEGTKALTVGELLGYTLNSDVDANKVFSIGESLIIDEDIILTLAMLPKPDGVETDYVVFYRSTADRWAWEFSKMPFKFNSATNWIQWDNNGVLTDATGGTGANTRWINTYLTLTNFQGEARFLFFSGQNIFTNFDTAKDEDISTFTWGNFVIVESVLVYRLTWTTITSTSTGKCRLAAVTPIAVNPIVTPTAGGGIAHNTLGGLQGGTVTERYHLTELQRDRAIKAVKALKISIIGL